MRFERCHAQCPGFASILNGEVFLARYDRRGGLRLDQNEIFGRVHQLDRAGPIHWCGGRRTGLFFREEFAKATQPRYRRGGRLLASRVRAGSEGKNDGSSEKGCDFHQGSQAGSRGGFLAKAAAPFSSRKTAHCPSLRTSRIALSGCTSLRNAVSPESASLRFAIIHS